MSENFTLRWNDFHVGVADNFRKFRNAEDFYDVTLVSDDQQQVSAHKIVLASASQYFENILKKNQHSHPLLCLDGIDAKELMNIVDYIYNGELQISQEHLDTFLQVAQRFQIEGLMQGEGFHIQNEISEEEEEYVQIEEDWYDERTTAVKKEFTEEDISCEQVSPLRIVQLEENIDLETKVESRKHKSKYIKKRNFAMINFKFNTIDELDRKLEEMIEKEEGINGSSIFSWKCKQCGKPCRSKSHAVEHAELHVEGLVFSCKYCSRTVHSRSLKRRHEATCIDNPNKGVYKHSTNTF